MPPVVFEFNETPTQMGLKGSTIEGIVGISFMLGILAFFVILSFARHIRVRRPGRVQGSLPVTRRLVGLDAVQGPANNLQPPPPAYDSLYADAGRPQSWPWSGLYRWGMTASQLRNMSDAPEPSGAAIEGIRDPFGFSSSPTSVHSVLPPYSGRDPHGLPSYETAACSGEVDRIQNARSAMASQAHYPTREDVLLGLNTRERRAGFVVTEREISPNEP